MFLKCHRSYDNNDDNAVGDRSTNRLGEGTNMDKVSHFTARIHISTPCRQHAIPTSINMLLNFHFLHGNC